MGKFHISITDVDDAALSYQRDCVKRHPRPARPLPSPSSVAVASTVDCCSVCSSRDGNVTERSDGGICAVCTQDVSAGALQFVGGQEDLDLGGLSWCSSAVPQNHFGGSEYRFGSVHSPVPAPLGGLHTCRSAHVHTPCGPD